MALQNMNTKEKKEKCVWREASFVSMKMNKQTLAAYSKEYSLYFSCLLYQSQEQIKFMIFP